MGLLAHALTSSGLTRARSPCYIWLSLAYVVPMVTDLVSRPRVLEKRALILVNLFFLFVVKLSSALSDLE
jgi:hypothetical protein